MANAQKQAAACVNVHILTENRLLRETLAHLLGKRNGVCVVDVSESIEGAAEKIAASLCEVVLTDCLTAERAPGLLREICAENSSLKVVLFGMEENPECFLKAIYLGVNGYILKDASASEIIAALRAVVEGEAVCPPKLFMGLIKHLARESRESSKSAERKGSNGHSLTRRQLELLRLVAQGLSNKQIASSLNLSEFTVKNHMRRIMKQVNAGDRYEAVDAVRSSGALPGA